MSGQPDMTKARHPPRWAMAAHLHRDRPKASFLRRFGRFVPIAPATPPHRIPLPEPRRLATLRAAPNATIRNRRDRGGAVRVLFAWGSGQSDRPEQINDPASLAGREDIGHAR